MLLGRFELLSIEERIAKIDESEGFQPIELFTEAERLARVALRLVNAALVAGHAAQFEQHCRT